MPLPNLLLVSCKIGKVRPNSESGGARSVRLVFFNRQKSIHLVYAGTVLIWMVVKSPTTLAVKFQIGDRIGDTSKKDRCARCGAGIIIIYYFNC